MCTRKLDTSPVRKQYTGAGPVPNAHNISTFIPSFRRRGRINPTPAGHYHRAGAIHSLYITAQVSVP